MLEKTIPQDNVQIVNKYGKTSLIFSQCQKLDKSKSLSGYRIMCLNQCPFIISYNA